jgi:cardiolipin synthase
MFRIEGSTVQELQFGFLSDWSFMSGEPPEALLTQDAFPGADDAGENMVRVVPSGPGDGIDVLPDVIFNAVAMARRQILLFTPYFVPTPDLLRCLRSAALRGVEVKLMVPRDNNHVYAGWAARSFYETLLDAGVQVFERKPPFSHSKALMVDDAFALIGSANFDARSLRLNYESNLAVLGGPFMDALKAVMLQELAEAVPVDPQAWRTRAIWRRLTENACALLTPVL